MAKKDSKDSKNESKVKKHFFKDFKAELKKVIWPTPKQLLNNTSAVIAIVLISAVMVFILDIAFEFVNKEVVTNLQEVVNEKFNSSEDQNSSDKNTESNSTEGNTEETNSEEQNTTESTEQENTTTSTDKNTETSENGEQTNTDQQ